MCMYTQCLLNNNIINITQGHCCNCSSGANNSNKTDMIENR